MSLHTVIEHAQSVGPATPEVASSQDTLLTITEVARRLRVDSTTVRRWITLGVLDAVILPHQGKRLSYRVRQQTLDQLLLSPASLPEHGSNA